MNTIRQTLIAAALCTVAGVAMAATPATTQAKPAATQAKPVATQAKPATSAQSKNAIRQHSHSSAAAAAPAKPAK